MDGDYGTSSELKFAEGKNTAWIQWEYPQAFAARSFTIAMPQPTQSANTSAPHGDFSYSQDGRELGQS